eukprot:672600-Pleurochrysis_carterae.AAC.3
MALRALPFDRSDPCCSLLSPALCPRFASGVPVAQVYGPLIDIVLAKMDSYAGKGCTASIGRGPIEGE